LRCVGRLLSPSADGRRIRTAATFHSAIQITARPIAGIGLISSLCLAACNSLFFHPKGADPAKRWSLLQADAACNTEIERKRWGSLLAIFTYKQRERDHGYAACVANKLADGAEAK